MITSVFNKAKKMLQVLRNVYPEIPPQQILLFLEVAEHEGVTMPELQRLTGMPQGSLSRNVKELSVYLERDKTAPERSIKKGHELLDKRPDMYNPRCYALFLSKKGKEVARQIEEVLA